VTPKRRPSSTTNGIMIVVVIAVSALSLFGPSRVGSPIATVISIAWIWSIPPLVAMYVHDRGAVVVICLAADVALLYVGMFVSDVTTTATRHRYFDLLYGAFCPTHPLLWTFESQLITGFLGIPFFVAYGLLVSYTFQEVDDSQDEFDD